MSVSKGYDETTYTTYTLQLADADYEMMTEMLYDEFVSQMTAEGFDVVSKEDVMATKAYQALEGEPEEKENSRRARYAPHGMKNLRTFNGQAKDRGDFAGINQELGVDASVAVFANIGVCDVAATGKHPGGVQPCLYGNLLQYPGFNMQFIGGAEQKGDKVKSAWDWRVYKDIVEWKYGGKDMYDAAFFGMTSVMTPGRRSFWHGRAWDAQSEAFIEGGGDVFQQALSVGLWDFDQKTAKQRKEAGVVKRAAPDLVPPPDAAPAPAPVATTYDVTALPGTEACYFGPVSVSVGDKEVLKYDGLVRRGIDGNSYEEDSVSYLSTGPVRNAAKYTTDGTTVTGKETSGAFTVTGAVAGTPDTWKTWDTVFTIGAMTTHAHYELTDAGLTIRTRNMDDKGNVTAGTNQTLALLPADQCHEKLKTVPPPAGGF